MTPGTPAANLETPALVIDLDALEHNIGVIANHYRNKKIRLRPHGKNHKSPQIFSMQRAAGGTVDGVCAAKVSEAEVFADAGIDNVLIANQVVDADKIRRLARLARHTDVMVAIDDQAQVGRLATGARDAGATIGVVIEVDTMMRRGGVRSVAAAVQLAQRVSTAPGLRFRGVMSHQVPRMRSPNRQQRLLEGKRSIERVLEVKHAIEAAGLAVEIVSTGESWTYDVAATCDEVTEIEAGTYVVMEVPYAYMREFRFAARVMGRIVQRLDAHTALGDVPIDAIGAPNGPPTLDGVAGVAVQSIDHHGVTLKSAGEMPLAVGDPFHLLTHQQDVTMNRWERYIGVGNGIVERVVEAPARGCIH